MNKNQLQSLIAEKLTVPQIAGATGKSESTIRKYLKIHGLKTFRFVLHDIDAKSRVCKYCDTEKPIGEFPFTGSDKIYRRWKCNTCYVQMKTDRIGGLKDWIKELKQGLKCEHCGNPDHRVMDFHHNGDKDFDVATAVFHGYSKEKILQEIAKCIPLCSNCHRIWHYEERNGV